MSTDFIRDNSDRNGLSELLRAKLQGWNPTLIFSFMPGYKATVSWDLKLHVTCRGPRTISTDSVPFDPSKPTDPDLNDKQIHVYYVAKSVNNLGSTTYLIPNVNTVDEWNKAAAEDAISKNELYAGAPFLSVEDIINLDVPAGSARTAIVCTNGWKDVSTVPLGSYIQFASDRIQTVKFVDSGNGNYNLAPNTLLSTGLRTYDEEQGQLVTSCLRVDGSKCYSESMGGIHAVGYMDLQGAGPDSNGDVNTGDAVIANGFVQVGDVTDQDTLMQVNIADSGPQYVEQYQSPDPALQTGEYDFTDAATFVDAIGGNEITIDPAILADLEGLRIQFNVEYTGRTFGQQVLDYTYTVGSQYTETPLIQVYYRVELPAVDAPEQDASVSGRVEVRSEAPIVLTADQVLGFLRLANAEDTVKIGCMYDGNHCYLVSSHLVVGDLLSIPVTASKVWNRIKGFFKKAWKAIKNIVPKVAKVVSPVLPPPYGTVVASIGTAVTGIDTVVNTVATCATKTGELLGDTPVLSEEDAFVVTPQYRLYPEETGAPVDILQPNDDGWISLPSVRVGITQTSETLIRAKQQFSEVPDLQEQLRTFYSTALGPLQGTPKLGLQQRLKVLFDKKCTRAQASNFITTLRMGASCGVTEGTFQVPMTEEEFRAFMENPQQ